MIPFRTFNQGINQSLIDVPLETIKTFFNNFGKLYIFGSLIEIIRLDGTKQKTYYYDTDEASSISRDISDFVGGGDPVKYGSKIGFLRDLDYERFIKENSEFIIKAPAGVNFPYDIVRSNKKIRILTYDKI